MLKILVPLCLIGFQSFAQNTAPTNPACAGYYHDSAEKQQKVAWAAGAASAALFSGGVVGVFKRGWRLPGLISFIATGYTGGLGRKAHAVSKFQRLLSQSAQEAQNNVVGRYTTVLTEMLNHAIYEPGTFSERTRAEMAQSLANRRVAPEEILRATRSLIDQQNFCGHDHVIDAFIDWSALMVVLVTK